MNFLKKLFKKSAATEAVPLEELQGWFSKKSEPFYQEIKKRLDDLFDDIESAREELENNLISLRKAKLSNPNITTKEIQMMEGNRANYVKSMPIEERNRVIRTYTEFRTSRRHRPGRAFEMVDYTFELFTNFGIFRDLHRHRKIGRAHV